MLEDFENAHHSFSLLLYVTLCPFSFCNHLAGEERAGCFASFVFLVSRDWFVALACVAMGLSAVCGCDISLSYSLTIFNPLKLSFFSNYSKSKTMSGKKYV